jgi:hypothetical protein
MFLTEAWAPPSQAIPFLSAGHEDSPSILLVYLPYVVKGYSTQPQLALEFSV